MSLFIRVNDLDGNEVLVNANKIFRVYAGRTAVERDAGPTTIDATCIDMNLPSTLYVQEDIDDIEHLIQCAKERDR